jgi:hypothetical protein
MSSIVTFGVAYAAVAATTIGTDISTGGNLTVTGWVQASSFKDGSGNAMLGLTAAGADSSFYLQNNTLGNNPILGVQATGANQGMTIMIKGDSTLRVQDSNTAMDFFSIKPSHSSSSTSSQGSLEMKEDLTANRVWSLQNSSGVIPLGTAANDLFFTTSANTSVTLPASGTLATLAGTETFTNKTLTSPTIAAWDGIYTSVGAAAPALAVYGMPANVNYIEVGSGASGGSPGIAVKTTGADVNVGLTLGLMGSGDFVLASTTANADRLAIAPAVGGGAIYTGRLTSADLTAARNWTFPNASGTVALTSDSTGLVSVSYGGTGFGAYTAGDLLYASGAAAISKLAIGTSGQVLTSNGTSPYWAQSLAAQFAADSNDPTGFVNNTSSTLSFNDATRTMTITPVGSFDVYVRGTKFTKSSAETCVITDTEGLWIFYYDASGTLQCSQTTPSFSQTAYAAAVYWDATNNAHLYLGDERHGMAMDGATHAYLHNTVGTRYSSGLTLAQAGGLAANPPASNADAQVSMTGGDVFDEDLRHTIVHSAAPSNPLEQVLSPAAVIPVYYRSGASGEWRLARTADTFPVDYGGTGKTRWNQYSGGNWSMTEPNDLEFVAYWIFATNDIEHPIISIAGQQVDASISNARNNNKYESLSLGAMPFKEMKLLYRLIYRTSSAYINSTPRSSLYDIQDLRSVSNLPSGTYVATAHSSLTALDYAGSGHTGFAGTGVANSFTLGQTIASGGASLVALTVTGAAAQTANLQEWKDSGGTVLAAVSAAGDLDVNGNILHTVQSGITAFAGGGQANAVAITAEIALVSTVATANDSVKLPAAAAGKVITVINAGVNNLYLFPASTEKINNGIASNPVAVLTGYARTCYGIDTSNWYCPMTAY